MQKHFFEKLEKHISMGLKLDTFLLVILNQNQIEVTESKLKKDLEIPSNFLLLSWSSG